MSEKTDINRILILGDSLSAEGIAGLLAESEKVTVTGKTGGPEEALALLEMEEVDVLVIVDTDDGMALRFSAVTAQYPEIPVVRVDIDMKKIQVLVSQSIRADIEELVAAVSALPRRGYPAASFLGPRLSRGSSRED